MLAWSPILIQKIEIHALGFVLRKLQLNRHREAEVASHGHEYTQLILYLAGEGVQVIGGRRHEARAGDLFIIPPSLPHGYAVGGNSRPLCLVLDYETARRSTRLTHRRLPQHTLNELHGLLTRVPTKGRPTLSDYPAIIAVIARLLEPSAADQQAPATTPLIERVRGRLREAPSLEAVARDAGYTRDTLSRKFKREHGLGLRALRDQLRLEAAQQALKASAEVAEAAAKAGFDDPNYFSRWFKKQTGTSPSRWRG